MIERKNGEELCAGRTAFAGIENVCFEGLSEGASDATVNDRNGLRVKVELRFDSDTMRRVRAGKTMACFRCRVLLGPAAVVVIKSRFRWGCKRHFIVMRQFNEHAAEEVGRKEENRDDISEKQIHCVENIQFVREKTNPVHLPGCYIIPKFTILRKATMQYNE